MPAGGGDGLGHILSAGIRCPFGWGLMGGSAGAFHWAAIQGNMCSQEPGWLLQKWVPISLLLTSRMAFLTYWKVFSISTSSYMEGDRLLTPCVWYASWFLYLDAISACLWIRLWGITRIVCCIYGYRFLWVLCQLRKDFRWNRVNSSKSWCIRRGRSSGYSLSVR